MGFLIFLLVILVLVVLFFAVLDRMSKGKSEKKKPAKTPDTKPAPVDKPDPKPVVEDQTPRTIQIYNSELADDLNAMLKNSDDGKTSRLQIENHMNKESNITKYLQSKNYHGFDFGPEDGTATTDEKNEPLSFTREDYKRIVAFSNIDDKK